MSSIAKFVFFFLLVVSLGIFQIRETFKIGDVNPNLGIVVMVVLFFFVAERLFLVLCALSLVFLFSWQPGLGTEILVFSAVLTLVYILKKYIRSHPIPSSAFLISVSTLGFYIFAGMQFLKEHYMIVGGEIVYNVIFGALLFIILSNTEKRLQ